MRKQSAEMKACIETCRECHRVCQETLAYCLEEGGRHAESTHLTTMLACVELCGTSANFMTWGDELHTELCRLCADICGRCADSCENFPGDETMGHCAQVCRRCAESCSRMAGVAVA